MSKIAHFNLMRENIDTHTCNHPQSLVVLCEDPNQLYF